MRKARTKAAKVICIFLAVVLTFSGFNMYTTAMATNSSNEAAAFCDEYYVTDVQYHEIEIHGSVDINDFPLTDEPWLEDSELQAMRDEVFLVCHGVSSYDMPYEPGT